MTIKKAPMYGIFLSRYDWDHHRALYNANLQRVKFTGYHSSAASAAIELCDVADKVTNSWGEMAHLDMRILGFVTRPGWEISDRWNDAAAVDGGDWRMLTEEEQKEAFDTAMGHKNPSSRADASKNQQYKVYD